MTGEHEPARERLQAGEWLISVWGRGSSRQRLAQPNGFTLRKHPESGGKMHTRSAMRGACPPCFGMPPLAGQWGCVLLVLRRCHQRQLEPTGHHHHRHQRLRREARMPEPMAAQANPGNRSVAAPERADGDVADLRERGTRPRGQAMARTPGKAGSSHDRLPDEPSPSLRVVDLDEVTDRANEPASLAASPPSPPWGKRNEPNPLGLALIRLLEPSHSFHHARDEAGNLEAVKRSGQGGVAGNRRSQF